MQEKLAREHPGKLAPLNEVFGNIRPGNRIFIGTGCGEPQYLVRSLIEYVESHPKALFDTEVFQVFPLGAAPYMSERYESHFRHDSFFIGEGKGDALHAGIADYTPIHLFQVPEMISRGLLPIDVVLIQTSPPDADGYLSLGVSVDIVKAAVEKALLVIAQVNSHMPRVCGDSLIHSVDVDYFVPHDEPIIEIRGRDENGSAVPDDVIRRIGQFVSGLVRDGDTLQVGTGGLPDAILPLLGSRRHMGVHTEMLSDGVIELIRKGVVDNSRKNVNRGKTVAAYTMGTRGSYEFLHENPDFEFRTIDYTNNPLVIAQHDNMVTLNTTLEVDLTGLASTETVGRRYRGAIGGMADFMRGAVLSPNGRTIILLPSTNREETVSHIIPLLREGAGGSLNRSDVYYVVTEYGVAHLRGKNIRRRAMELIAIAHPKFRPWLVEEARRRNLIFRDQVFIEGKGGEYPEHFESRVTTGAGMNLLLRPVKICDEPLLKDFFYSLSDRSRYQRFFSVRRDMPHRRLQEFVVIDYTKEMVILAIRENEDQEVVVGVGQYQIDEQREAAELSFVVRDDCHGQGAGTELVQHLVNLGKQRGLKRFTAELLEQNTPALRLFEKLDLDIERICEEGTYFLRMTCRGPG